MVIDEGCFEIYAEEGTKYSLKLILGWKQQNYFEVAGYA